MAICVVLSELYVTYKVFLHTISAPVITLLSLFALLGPLSWQSAEECSSLMILLSSYWLTELRSPDSGRQLDPVGLHISLISLLGTSPKLIKICHFSWQNWQRVAKNEKPPFVAHCLKGTLFGEKHNEFPALILPHCHLHPACVEPDSHFLVMTCYMKSLGRVSPL